MIINCNPDVAAYRDEQLAKLHREEAAALNEIMPLPDVLLLMAEAVTSQDNRAMQRLVEWRAKAADVSDKHSNAKKSINGAKTVAAIRKAAEG